MDYLSTDILNTVLSYINLSDATNLRIVAKSFAELVTAYPWNDTKTVIYNFKL